MGLITNTTMNATQYAAGFNQGMEQASQTFQLIIQVLVFTFAVRMIVNFPWLKNRIENKTKLDIVETVEFSADVLAFFLTVMIYWTMKGNALIK